MLTAEIAIKNAAPAFAGTAATAEPPGSLTAETRELAAKILRSMEEGQSEILTEEALGELFGALCKLYSCNAEQQERLSPIRTDSSANATAVLMTTTALLRGAKLELFEIGMWLSWSGMK
jgi:hypothetical protein